MRELQTEHHERFSEAIMNAYERYAKGKLIFNSIGDADEVEDERREVNLFDKVIDYGR